MMTDTASKTRVALIFGGRSSEHAISCATAASVLSAIDRDRYDVIPIGISRQGQWVLMPDDPEPLRITAGRLPAVPEDGPSVLLPLSGADTNVQVLEPGQPPRELGEVDVVFPLLHGAFGEDGTIQGMLELAGMPYVGCGVTSSAIMMDKAYMRLVFASAGIPQTPYVVITPRRWAADPEGALAECAALEFPVFVKPCRAGSSYGVTRVTEAAGLRDAIQVAREIDPKVMVEQGVVGCREIECGVLDSGAGEPLRVSPVGEIVVAEHAMYDFEAKYLDSSTRLQIPADLPGEVAEQLRAWAAEAFVAADCEGLARCDFFYTPDGRLLINEINTMPGFTPVSMYPQVWSSAGVSYPELIDELIQLALRRPVGLR